MSNEMPDFNRKLLYVYVLYICLFLGAQGKSQCRKISRQMLYVPSIVNYSINCLKTTLNALWTDCYKSDHFHWVIFHDAFIKVKIYHSNLNSIFALCLL